MADLLWVAGSITHPELTTENFSKWYEEIHIPEILDNCTIDSAIRWKGIDVSIKRPWLVIYTVTAPDVMESQAVKNLNVVDPKLLPGPTHNIYGVAEFGLRNYKIIQHFEPVKQEGRGKFLLSAGFTPAAGTDEEYDKWYRHEYMPFIGKLHGFLRTLRYKLISASEDDVPAYIALHEFEELPRDEDIEASTQTPLAQKVLAAGSNAQVEIYEFTSGFGNTKRM